MKKIMGLECTFGEAEVTILQNRLTNNIIDSYPRKILQHDCPLPPIPKTTSDEQEAIMEATPFRSVTGSLAYLVSGSWPDLAFAVNYLARHSMAPTRTHWTILWGICSRPVDTALSYARRIALSTCGVASWSDLSQASCLNWAMCPFYGVQNNRPWWPYQHVPPSTLFFLTRCNIW
ncbi:hypothetical protein O181_002213 [Austropuccinia psidii MF-1]|uniref:Uncharacterized protein n=1 Tax=Austropuccinia psidii MF-1 TaxID=1389203 RepID=A0A9Q3BC17_9BASI|nr:hypothetical protein [Austropuccinia psidii MF-1]